MKITVVGTGYVGLVASTCLAEMGHNVMGVDIDENKIKQLWEGGVPFYEPGLQELVTKNISDKRLQFSTSIEDGVKFGTIIISAVGTPPDKDHRADLQHVKQVAKSFGELVDGYKVFINKSTVPVGTAETCTKIIQEEIDKRQSDATFDVVSNPEFLREGAAVKDFLNAERIIVGIPSSRAKDLLEKMYRPLVRAGKPLMFTDVKSAEIIKYAANCFLATKISFINEMANFCEKAGGDVREIAKGIGLDSRIGTRFLHAGIGYGGSCLPKDVKAIIQTGKEHDFDFSVIRTVDAVNDSQKELIFRKLQKHMPDLNGKTVAVWGVAFKPRTDDIREAPSLVIINKLLEAGANVKAFDPVAMDVAKEYFTHPNLTYSQTAFQAASEADALLILTEWDEFRAIELTDLKTKMRGHILLDGRNIYEPKEARVNGFVYEGIGRERSRIQEQDTGYRVYIKDTKITTQSV